MSALGTLGGIAGVGALIVYGRYVWRRGGEIANAREANEQRRQQSRERALAAAEASPAIPGVQCPTCHQQDSRRFQPIERSVYKKQAATQFVCKQCGYKW